MKTVFINYNTRTLYNESNGVLLCWAWCVDHFGPPNGERWVWDTYRKFTFKHDADAVLFSLKWL